MNDESATIDPVPRAKPAKFRKGQKASAPIVPPPDEPAPEKRPPPNAFQKGNTVRQSISTEFVGSPDDMAPLALQDMRHVYNNLQKHDTTLSQRNMRKYMKKKPDAFAAQLIRMEHEHKKWLEENGMGQVKKADLASEKCIELADKLIRRLEKEVA